MPKKPPPPPELTTDERAQARDLVLALIGKHRQAALLRRYLDLADRLPPVAGRDAPSSRLQRLERDYEDADAAHARSITAGSHQAVVAALRFRRAVSEELESERAKVQGSDDLTPERWKQQARGYAQLIVELVVEDADIQARVKRALARVEGA